MEDTDVQAIVKQAIQEFLQEQQAKSEPAYKTELVEERKRREQLERRLNEVEEESKRSRRREARPSGRSYNGWGLRRSTWHTERCTTAYSARRTAGCWRTATKAKCHSKNI